MIYDDEPTGTETPVPARKAALLAIGGAASKASHAGVGVAVFGGLTATDLAAFGGLAVALIGTVVAQGINWYYRHKEHQRAERESAARLRAALGSVADVPGGQS